jgi:hypothetical protein
VDGYCRSGPWRTRVGAAEPHSETIRSAANGGQPDPSASLQTPEFNPPQRLHTHILEGPYPVDGTWVLKTTDQGTQVEFTAVGSFPGLLRLTEPIAKRLIARQFAKFHENLRQNVAKR